MSESIIKTKSFELAVRGVSFYKYLVAEKKEFVISKQFFVLLLLLELLFVKLLTLKGMPILFINYLSPKKNVMKHYIG
jgi:hypothetical protein